jgi:AAA domain
VLVFLGEGGEWATVRRIEAIATAKGIDPDQLADQLRLCFRVPRLAAPGAGGELAAIQAELAEHPAVLVVLDPLYLAAAGASGSNLYDMGAVLQAIQGVCQHAGCALLVVTHWNKTGDGRGADRISRAGPAAWARVICSVSIQHRGSEEDGASTVLLGVEVIGGEVADTGFRIRRRVRAEDPIDLAAPLAYSVEVLAGDDDPEDLDPAAAALFKSRQWVLTALRAGGICRPSSSSATASPRPGTRSSLAPSRPPSASWKRPGWPPGARKATAEPATGHRPPPIRMPTALATVNRAMVGRGHGMTRLATSWIEASSNPPMEPRMSRWFASSSLTSEGHQGRNVLTSTAHHHENQAAFLRCCRSDRRDGRAPRR